LNRLLEEILKKQYESKKDVYEKKPKQCRKGYLSQSQSFDVIKA
jgi:hypothetical protein